MKFSPREHELTSLTPENEELGTPHFDDSAVAMAHQVEPLPTRPAIRSGSSRRAIIVAVALIIGVVLGVFAGVISSKSDGTKEAASVAAQTSAQMESLDETTAQTEMRELSIRRERSRARVSQANSQRTINRYLAEEFSDNEDDSPRPVARKVGVIYGRPPSEP